MPVEIESAISEGAHSIVVNGVPRSIAAGTTVAALIRELGLDPEAVAIERNREIVKSDRWSRAVIEAGDTIEVVHFVGGG